MGPPPEGLSQIPDGLDEFANSLRCDSGAGRFEMAADEAKAARLAICEGCERHDAGGCLECGCFVASF